MPPIDDHGDTFAAATALSPNTTVIGALEAAGDRDMFKVSMTEGRTYGVLLAGDGGVPLVAPKYRVYNDKFELIEEDLSSRLDVFAAPRDGTYYFEVAEFGDNDAGGYAFRIETVADEQPGGNENAASAIPILRNDMIFAALGEGDGGGTSDEDWYSFPVATPDPTIGGVYVVDVDFDPAASSKPQSLRFEVYLNGERVISSGPLDPDDPDGRQLYIPDAAGTAYLRIFDPSGGESSYRFSMQRLGYEDIVAGGAPFPGNMNAPNHDIDSYRVALEAQKSYAFLLDVDERSAPPELVATSVSAYSERNGLQDKVLFEERRGDAVDRAVAFSSDKAQTVFFGVEDALGVNSFDFLLGVVEIAGNGDDSLTLPGPSPLGFNAWGGDDRVRGTGFADTVKGGAGDDVLLGMGGGDRLIGGAGADALRGGGGDDLLRGGGGADRSWGAGGDDRIISGGGDDKAWGKKGDDFIKTGGGDDVAKGGGGKDKVRGGGGDDLLKTQGGNDKAWGGKGDDKIAGGGGKDLIKGQGGKDKLLGGGDKDKLLGNGGNDDLRGGGGADILKGGGGKDVLHGGKGPDKLFGNKGADTFLFKKGDGRVEVKDLQKIDDIDFAKFNGSDASLLRSGANDGGDYVVEIGTDMLVLSNTSRKELERWGWLDEDGPQGAAEIDG